MGDSTQSEGVGNAQHDTIKVAFLGPKASYTHQAALALHNQPNHELVPASTIEDVFTAVQTGSAARGVVPFENSTNGSVVFTLDLFADLQHKHPDILVCDELYLPVHHCLVGHPPSSPTSSDSRPSQDQDLSHITKLYSHPQAWGQCKRFLAAHLKGIERQDVSSTSRAAELVSQEGHTSTSAAVSSRMAAEVYNLPILASSIEDEKGNSTRFFVLERRWRQDVRSADPQQQTAHVTTETETEVEAARYKTLVAFTVSHEEPGALADCLAVLKRHGLNLTSINTRPGGSVAWNYVFFVEFRGKMSTGGPVEDALRELEGVARSSRWLGSWEDALAT